MREMLRAAFVIARRDFAATVFSRTFLLFLLGPLFPVAVMVVFGSLNQSGSEAEQPVVAIVADAQQYAALSLARDRLASALPRTSLVRLRHVPPHGDAEALRAALLQGQDSPVLAVLEGGLDEPRLTGAVRPEGTTARQLQLIIDDARFVRVDAPAEPPAIEVVTVERSSGSTASARALTARAGQALLFVLTILLAGMLLSQLIEEKSNKIIEVLAAAVAVESIFFGKLVAMLAASLVGILMWTAAGAAAIALFAQDGLQTLPPPAVGWPVFIALGLTYFAMSYLLLGSIFIGIGAHASTAREVQTLSMPVTMAQVVVFAAAALAIGKYDSTLGLAAAIFPLTSPYVMMARAAELPQFWPHLLAVLWQLVWLALFLKVAAHLFRRSVLQSGPARGSRRPARA